MEKKVIAVKFNLENESERRCYEELLSLDGGAFTTASGYAKAILIHYLKEKLEVKERSQKPEIDYDFLATKVAERLKQKPDLEEPGAWEDPESNYYDKNFG